MHSQKVGTTFIVLLQGAGFALMLLFGYGGIGLFLLGLALYLCGMALSAQLHRADDMETVGRFTVILCLLNLVFYSTRKIAPLLDVSLAIYLLTLVQLAVLVWVKRVTGQKFPLRFPYARAALVYLAAIALSFLGAAHAKEVFYFFMFNLAALLLFYASINLFSQSEKFVLATVRTVVVTAFLSAGLAVWQLYSSSFKFFYYPFIALRDQKLMELWELVSRVVGTWQHPSYLGMYLALSLPLAMYLLFYEAKQWWTRVVLAVGIIFTSAAILLTNTRSSVLAGIFAVVLFYLLSHLHRAQFLRQLPGYRKVAVVGLSAAAALLLYQFVFVEKIYRKPQALRLDASATIWGRFLRSDSMSSESLIQRSDLYRLAWRLFVAHPVTGIGAKNFPSEVEKEFNKEGTDAHNILLQTLAEMGIIGLAGLLLLYGTVLGSVGRILWSAQKAPLQRYVSAALAAGVVLMIFDSFFNNPLYSLRLTAVFWLLVALLQVDYLSSAIDAGEKNVGSVMGNED